jgi:hypothetical protein
MYPPPVLVYGVVSANTEQAVELFPDREQAEEFIAEVRAGRAGHCCSPQSRGDRAV